MQFFKFIVNYFTFFFLVSFKVKYFVANNPGIVLALLIGCVLTPIGVAIKYPFVKDSVHHSLDKYHPKYTGNYRHIDCYL